MVRAIRGKRDIKSGSFGWRSGYRLSADARRRENKQVERPVVWHQEKQWCKAQVHAGGTTPAAVAG